MADLLPACDRRETRVGAAAYREFMSDLRELAEVSRRAAGGRGNGLLQR